MNKKRSNIKKEILDFNAVFHEEERGGYSVSVPALPGCFSQGDTFEKAAENIREAIELYLEGEKKNNFLIPAKKEFMAPVRVAV